MKRTAALIALALLASPALAQKKMYRCGSQYQDRPCDSAKAPASEATSPTATPTASTRSAQQDKREAQKKIRCENFSRQRDELREKQRAANKQVAESLGAQIKALDERINTDGC